MVDLLLKESFTITGIESQTLHIVLRKNRGIIINKKNLITSSTTDLKETQFNNLNLILTKSQKYDKNSQFKRFNDSLIVNLKNTNPNTEYLSLSQGGKIMKIIPCFYENLFIRTDSLLACNNDIELLEDLQKNEEINKVLIGNIFQNNISTYINKNIRNGKQFCLVQSQMKIGPMQKNKNAFNNYLFKNNNLIKDIVFISTKKNLIEKRLGENEKIILLGDSLVAFEKSVKLNNLKKDKRIDKYVNCLNDIVLEGPGLIIFEPTDKFLINSNPNKIIYFIIISILMLILEILVQYLILM